MNLVIVESPYAGDVAGNVAYARAAVFDCITRGEAPICSHLLFPGILNDAIPAERTIGITAGLAWRRACDYAVFYVDHGYSPGMLASREIYQNDGIRIEERTLARDSACGTAE